MGCIIVLLASSILLFLAGYNFAFNTDRTISWYISRAKYKEGSKMYIRLLSKSNARWMKVCGFVNMIFS